MRWYISEFRFTTWLLYFPGNWLKNTLNSAVSDYQGYEDLKLPSGFSSQVQWIWLFMIPMSLITLVATPIVTFVKCKKENRGGNAIKTKVKNWFSFGWIIRLHLQCFLFVTLAVLTELRLEAGNIVHGGSYAFAIISLFVLFALLITVPIHYLSGKSAARKKGYRKSKGKKFLKNYFGRESLFQAFYDGIKIKTWYTGLYYFWFLLHRLGFVLVIFWCQYSSVELKFSFLL